MKQNSLIASFHSFIQQEQLFSIRESVLLAVSGGVDSAVMADLFSKSGFQFGIAHCNFQLRGVESDEDALFVKQLSIRYGVPFFTTTFDTSGFSKEQKLSIEEAARNLRYQWLEEIRSHFQYSHIATAHHLNDSIETVLMHIIHGTGIRGLQGIPVVNGKIIRPLLFAEKKTILRYAEENHLPFREDHTNREIDFERNKIRNSVIPILKELNPSFDSTFADSILHWKHASMIYRESLDRTIRRLVNVRGKDEYIPVLALRNIPYHSTLLHYYLSPRGFNEAQVHQILGSAGHPGRQFYSGTHRVITDRKYLIVTRIEGNDSGSGILDKDMKSIQCGDKRITYEISKYNSEMRFNDSGDVAYFDAEKIDFPLLVRTWKQGDYLYPLGLKKKNSDKQGRKKVSDILTDAKVDSLNRERAIVVVSGDYILWVAGVRQDGRFAVTTSTSRLLRIKIENVKR